MPKNVKGKTFWDFLASIVLQISKQTKGRPFGGIQKVQKTSHGAEKNPSEKHQREDPMRSRIWTSMFLLLTNFWRFEYVLDVRSSS